MKAILHIDGVIGVDTTLKSVIAEYKSYTDVSEVLAVVDSIGGSVRVADEIYSFLDGLKSKIEVATDIRKAYSAAAKVAAVGTTRYVDDTDRAIMIHLPKIEIKGDAEVLERVAAQMRGIESEFKAFYSDVIGVDESAVMALLSDETFVSGKEAVRLGFATQLNMTDKAVAILDDDNFNNTDMSKKENEEKKESRDLLCGITALFEKFLGEKKIDPKAILTLQDSTGSEIVFPDLETESVPKVGDKAERGGAPISDESLIMPSLDGEPTIRFEGGEVVEIIEKELGTDEQSEEDVAAEVQAKYSEILEDVKKMVRDEVKAEYDSKIADKETQITDLKRKIESKSIDVEDQEPEGKGSEITGAARYFAAARKK